MNIIDEHIRLISLMNILDEHLGWAYSVIWLCKMLCWIPINAKLCVLHSILFTPHPTEEPQSCSLLYFHAWSVNIPDLWVAFFLAYWFINFQYNLWCGGRNYCHNEHLSWHHCTMQGGGGNAKLFTIKVKHGKEIKSKFDKELLMSYELCQ